MVTLVLEHLWALKCGVVEEANDMYSEYLARQLLNFNLFLPCSDVNFFFLRILCILSIYAVPRKNFGSTFWSTDLHGNKKLDQSIVSRSIQNYRLVFCYCTNVVAISPKLHCVWKFNRLDYLLILLSQPSWDTVNEMLQNVAHWKIGCRFHFRFEVDWVCVAG